MYPETATHDVDLVHERLELLALLPFVLMLSEAVTRSRRRPTAETSELLSFLAYQFLESRELGLQACPDDLISIHDGFKFRVTQERVLLLLIARSGSFGGLGGLHTRRSNDVCGQ